MNAAYLPHYTYSDYIHWKEDWELIGGMPYSLLPSPVIRHGRVQVEAIVQARQALDNNPGCNCLVLSEIDWKINENTVVRPNLMIICGEPKTDFLEFPPVLIMEIISPSSRVRDRRMKFELYQEQGVQYYLLADYEWDILEAYELVNNAYQDAKHHTFELEPGCEISLDAAALWA